MNTLSRSLSLIFASLTGCASAVAPGDVGYGEDATSTDTCPGTTCNAQNCGCAGAACPSGSLCRAGVCSRSTPTVRWTRVIAGEPIIVQALSAGPNGNFVATGSVHGTADFGSGARPGNPDTDLFLAMYRSDGVLQWASRYGYAGRTVAFGSAVAIDSAGGVVVGGSFRDRANFGGVPLTGHGDFDGVTASYAADGAHRWSRAIGASGDDRVIGIASARGREVLATGYAFRSVDFGGGPVAVGNPGGFVARYGPDGALHNARAFQSSGWASGREIAALAGGDAVVAGVFSGRAAFGVGLTSTGESDGFVARVSPEGEIRWATRLGGAGSDDVHAVAVGSDGAVYVTGMTIGPTEAGGARGRREGYVASFAADGSPGWFRGGLGSDVASVAVDAGGNPIVAGVFTGDVNFGAQPVASRGGSDGFVASYSRGGELLWAHALGGTGNDAATAVSVDACSGVVVAGMIEGRADLIGAGIVSQGRSSAFLLGLGL